MTVPTGYPDWQHISTTVGAALISDITKSYPSGNVYAAVNVANYREVFLAVIPGGTTSWSVSVQWQDAAIGGNVMAASTYICKAPSTPLRINLPVVTPWLKIAITPIPLSSTDTVTVYVVPTSNHNTPATLKTPMINEIVNVTLAGNASMTQDAVMVAPGPAQWTISTTGTTATFIITAENADGTFRNEYQWATSGGPFFTGAKVVLPPQATQLYIQNTGAAAASFWSILGADTS